MGDDLSDLAVAACCSLQQYAVFIRQLCGQAIQLEHQHTGLLTHEAQQLRAALGLVQRQERDRVGGFFQLAHGGRADSLRRGIGHDDARLLFQPLQLVKQPVIYLV